MWPGKIILITALILASQLSIAAGNRAPIHIEADSVELDEKTGTSSYTGNVKLIQGLMSIKASKITVFTDKQNLQKIIAEGKSATFEQKYDDPTLPDVTASAEKIIYDAQMSTLNLSVNVLLTQGENRFSGDAILYDTRNNIMKATSDSKSKRVQAIIQLDSIKK